ncbi:hypothetical protein ACWCXB_03735 [Streptomyces sp. NPDC001514]
MRFIAVALATAALVALVATLASAAPVPIDVQIEGPLINSPLIRDDPVPKAVWPTPPGRTAR